MTHTLGPWILEDNPTSYDFIRLLGMDGRLHMGYLNKQPGNEDRVLADARLITASPDMYTALHDVDDAEMPLHDRLHALANLIDSGAPFDDLEWMRWLRRQAELVEKALGKASSPATLEE